MRQAGWIVAIVVLCSVSLLITPGAKADNETQFECYFETNQSDLRPQCISLISDVVATWHRLAQGRQYKSDLIDRQHPYAAPYVAHLQIRGYAPDVRLPRQADVLSVRRAAAVAAELQRQGISEDYIAVVGYGNEQRRIPDAPLDPINRLVQISFY